MAPAEASSFQVSVMLDIWIAVAEESAILNLVICLELRG
jgi:hypothetical protein